VLRVGLFVFVVSKCHTPSWSRQATAI